MGPEATTCRVIVVIALSKEMGTGNFSFKVPEGERILKLAVDWVHSLIDLDLCHRNMLYCLKTDNIEKYHQNYLGFDCTRNASCDPELDIIL